MKKLKIQNNTKILFTGDSITDADRRNSPYSPMGNGYVHFAANLLLARYPQYDIEIINTGVSGDTTRTLNFRWQRDCIAHQPDILSLMIGINDVWCQHSDENIKRRAVHMEEFESHYTRMLTQVRESFDCQIVLMEPFMFCSDQSNDMLKTLRAYIELVHEFSHRFDTLLVPIQQEIDRIITNTRNDKWSYDMVHPYQWAHCWIGQRWIETVLDYYDKIQSNTGDNCKV